MVHYLDNAATTPVSEKSAEAVMEILRDYYGNPSSLYSIGIKASKKYEHAREVIAESLGCRPEEIFFTGCGTESNNLAIFGAARARKAWGNEVIVTGYEHPSVQNTVDALKDEGFEVITIAPENGVIEPEEIISHVSPKTVLVTAMMVNNETGAMLDVPYISKKVKEINKRTAVHCDFVQGYMKEKIDLASIDTLSASGHKINAPKGIGILYMRKGFNLRKTQFGGGQEKGIRSGTENIAFACGFAAAVEEHKDIEGNARKIAALKAMLAEGLREFDNVTINSPENSTPYVLNFSFEGYRSETVLHFLEARDVYVSSGSACSKGERSHTLEAMKLPSKLVDSAIRVSFGLQNTEDDVKALLDGLREAGQSLMKAKR
ncbi:MAG: cysteine desulfurase [Oscillospiraceae bacterium]|nr:cysteine desulfurase [Oscillospiraceae bacterium]